MFPVCECSNSVVCNEVFAVFEHSGRIAYTRPTALGAAFACTTAFQDSGKGVAHLRKLI